MRRKINIPASSGFCKKCFRQRRDGSSYCGECQDEPERDDLYYDDQKNFPLFDKVKELFPIGYNTVFAYGNTIFVNQDITDYGLLVHEITHLFQQKNYGLEKWWKKYLKDEKFRTAEEAEAYSKQYACYLKKDVKRAEVMLNNIAEELSGPLYGGIISVENAKKLIKDLYERK
jgi:hypothetical protein